jgi:glycosyltransferase involved in cell wall biosynthesis
LKSLKLSIILGVTGNHATIDSDIMRSLQTINASCKSECELILVYENSAWLNTPLNQLLPIRVKCEFSAQSADSQNLAILFNTGAAIARSDYLLFLWPGCELSSVGLANIFQQIDQEKRPDAFISPKMEILEKYGIDGNYFLDNFFTHFSSCENVLMVPQAVIQKRFFEQTGGFSTSKLLGVDFQREYFMRAYKIGCIITSTKPICLNVPEVGTINDTNLSRFVSQAFAVRCGFRGKFEMDEERKFIRDLPENNAKRLLVEFERIDYDIPNQRPLRVVLVSGAWEYHHNKLAFYNFFKILEGDRKLTFIPRLDRVITPGRDLSAADLVIICRGRSGNILKILDYCERFSIPVLYMIDDNWLVIGKDYPELYANIFAPGRLDYEVFIECLRRSSAVLVYNRVLEEDIKPYAQRVFRISANIAIKDFSINQDFTIPDEVLNLLEWREQSKGVVIGYAGSARFTDLAFRALEQASNDPNLNVRILLFGNLLPEHLKLFKGKTVTLPFTCYETYAHIMTIIHPDILVAPLENNRTSMSKCPNKYLEYSISGSAGIYSSIYPYNEVVNNRVNGLLVPKDGSEKDWLAAIKELVGDKPLRNSIIQSAKQDVLDNYETEKVLPQFLAVLGELVGD